MRFEFTLWFTLYTRKIFQPCKDTIRNSIFKIIVQEN